MLKNFTGLDLFIRKWKSERATAAFDRNLQVSDRMLSSPCWVDSRSNWKPRFQSGWNVPPDGLHRCLRWSPKWHSIHHLSSHTRNRSCHLLPERRQYTYKLLPSGEGSQSRVLFPLYWTTSGLPDRSHPKWSVRAICRHVETRILRLFGRHCTVPCVCLLVPSERPTS